MVNVVTYFKPRVRQYINEHILLMSNEVKWPQRATWAHISGVLTSHKTPADKLIQYPTESCAIL